MPKANCCHCMRTIHARIALTEIKMDAITVCFDDENKLRCFERSQNQKAKETISNVLKTIMK